MRLYMPFIINLQIFYDFVGKTEQEFCIRIVEICLSDFSNFFHPVGKGIPVNAQNICGFFVIMKALEIYFQCMKEFISCFLIIFFQSVQSRVNEACKSFRFWKQIY